MRRTNFDCDNLEKFLLGLGGDGSSSGSSGAFRGKRESGKEHTYSCVVLAGQRTMDERRRALQVCGCGRVAHALSMGSAH
jgi:ATP-dependent RNA helicase DDX1